MAQPPPPPPPPLPPHAWSGANKTVNDLQQERVAMQADLPPGESTQRALGIHFGHMEDVWGRESCRVLPPDFTNIKRTTAQGSLYQSCYNHIDGEIRDPDWTSGTANQQGNSEKVDPVGNLGGQSAHLLSHAKVCHRAYPFLAEAAVGIDVEELVGEKDLEGNLHTHRRKLLVGVKGHKMTSLKGHKFNKMYWKLQGEHFDTDDPSVLVVPLLTLNQIMNWASNRAQAVDYDVAVFTFGPRKTIVASETLVYAKGTCTPAEVELARQNLCHFVKGIAAHLVSQDVFEALSGYFVPKNPTLLRWRGLVEQLRGNPSIMIPTNLGAAAANVLIAKARMSTGTSLPDPWLLLAKSAINYSASNGQKLMPACPLPEESDSEESDIEDNDVGIPNESNGKDEKMSPLRAEFCREALQRGGFGVTSR